MFPALVAHLQEALNERNLLYCVRVMSVGCTRNGVGRSSRSSNSPYILVVTDLSLISVKFYTVEFLRMNREVEVLKILRNIRKFLPL
jgi:hypothetical protein